MSKANRRAARLSLLAICVACAGNVPAQTADDTLPQRQKLIEQKMRLVELLVSSPASKRHTTSDGPAAVGTLERRRQLLDAARLASAAGDLDRAGRLLDEALLSTARISSRRTSDSGGLDDDAQRAKLKNLAEQLGSYRATLQAQARERRTAAGAQSLLTLIETVNQEVEQLAVAGRFDDANRRLSEAYRVVVAGLAELQSGQTVTHSLSFETPADEYAYEQRRLKSNEMLLRISIDEAKPEGERLALIKTLVVESHRLRDEGIEFARLGDHRSAVTAMEKASTQLLKAMQTLGMPVF